MQWQDDGTGEEDSLGRLALASAPNFAVKPFGEKEIAYEEALFWPNITWSPEGEWILFGGANEKYPSAEISIPMAVRPNGQGLHAIKKDSNSKRYLNFMGWIDPHTLVMKDYMGGGGWSPKGERLVYQAASGTVEMLALPDGQRTRLDSGVSDRLVGFGTGERNPWSFDGTYLALDLYTPDAYGMVENTAVFKIQ